MYNPKFSLIVAVYNTAEYVAECIESIINQTIGFEKNVELILVDDGSTDNSGKICDEYEARFPQNIRVVHKANGGVSSARNEGMRYITGKYVSFPDSDDKLSLNALKEVWKFFEAHEEETDIVSIPKYFFEAKEGSHTLNYKFDKGSRVIDLTTEWNVVQNTVASAFIKSEVARKFSFDANLRASEDAKFMLLVLLQKPILGVCATTSYLYRRRNRGDSAVNTSKYELHFYQSRLYAFFYSILEKAKQPGGIVPKFVQFDLMYHTKELFCQSYDVVYQVLDNHDIVTEYLSLLYGLLQYIDDDVILAQRNLNGMQKCHLLCKKHKSVPSIKLVNGIVGLYAGEIFVCNYSACLVTLEFFHVTSDSIVIEGERSVFSLLGGDMEQPLFLSLGDKKFSCISIEGTLQNEYILNETTPRSFVRFKVTVPLQDIIVGNLRFVADILGQDIEMKNIATGKFFPTSKTTTGSYFVFDKFMMKQVKNVFWIRKRSLSRHIIWEAKFLYRILRHHKFGWRNALKAVALRCFYHIAKPLCKNEIWILRDRINKADDNAEALFKYMLQINSPVKRYFVLGKNAEGAERLRKFGKVIVYRGLKHMILGTLADKIISSAGDDEVLQPFEDLSSYFQDFIWHQKIVFLQHGVILHDLSEWLNRYKKNISLFITTTLAEYESIAHTYPYFYHESAICLAGLARHDYLENGREKIIVLAPTWRKYYVATNKRIIRATGARPYNPHFKESDYFKFYNSLMHNEKLNTVAKVLGYRICFFPNPTIVSNLCDFHGSETVEILDFNTPYREVFAKGSLLVTDFSSVAFDFAYLKKPVIYIQFDKERFFKEHWAPGYFDYERDGFGEVVYDLEHTVELIIDYIKNDCVLKDKYKERIEHTFAFWDRNNSKRNYEAILALK